MWSVGSRSWAQLNWILRALCAVFHDCSLFHFVYKTFMNIIDIIVRDWDEMSWDAVAVLISTCRRNFIQFSQIWWAFCSFRSFCCYCWKFISSDKSNHKSCCLYYVTMSLFFTFMKSQNIFSIINCATSTGRNSTPKTKWLNLPCTMRRPYQGDP